MRKYQHIFFDLDHTLWDFDANSGEAIGEIFTDLRIGERAEVSFETFVASYRIINKNCWDLYRRGEMDKQTLRTIRFRLALEKFGIHDSQLSKQFGDQYVLKSPQKTHLIDGTEEVLDYLASEEYDLHIITNGFSEVQFVKLENAGLKKYFDVVLTSEMVGEKKPHPAVFKKAISLANAQMIESLMVGDNLEADIIGARDMGMDQVYYNPENDPHEEKITHEITALQELLHIL